MRFREIYEMSWIVESATCQLMIDLGQNIHPLSDLKPRTANLFRSSLTHSVYCVIKVGFSVPRPNSVRPYELI
jgi:hypothetical protein